MNAAQLRPLIKQCESAAHLLKILAHPQRLQVLCHLSGRELTVSDLQSLCDLSQSHLSQFLQRMKSEGLISSRRSGKFVLYNISDSKVRELMQALHTVFCT
ncbi:MAG: helix-turn-helix domain-containing protein [Bdellovibrionales bacterium]|nr:helix-turn-helix domain-containing protein [Bdellovibrionales bacterium]